MDGVEIGVKDNGRRVIDPCCERRLCVGNTSSTSVCVSTPGWLEARIESS